MSWLHGVAGCILLWLLHFYPRLTSYLAISLSSICLLSFAHSEFWRLQSRASVRNRGYCLVTGASSGIGWYIAIEVAKKGVDVILVARRDNELWNLKRLIEKSHGVKAVVITSDLSKPGAAQELVSQIKKMNLTVSFLVNNAGFALNGKFVNEDLEAYHRMMIVNCVALMELTRLVLPEMIQAKFGRILMLSSMVSLSPAPEEAVYGATKAFVRSFGRAISRVLQGTGVTSTVLLPGATVATDFANRSHTEDSLIFNVFGFGTEHAQSVAVTGVEAMMAGKEEVISGWHNRFYAQAVASLPQTVAMAISELVFTPVPKWWFKKS